MWKGHEDAEAGQGQESTADAWAGGSLGHGKARWKRGERESDRGYGVRKEAVPNGYDGAPRQVDGGQKSRPAFPKNPNRSRRGRAHILLQLLGIGCVEPTPNPEAGVPGGPGRVLPVGREPGAVL